MKILSIRELNEVEMKKHNGIGLALVLKDDTTKTEMVLSYIYPMRGYGFQIGGLAADGSSAASEVIGLGNVVKAMMNANAKNMERSRSSIYSSNLSLLPNKYDESSIIHELINGQALIALNKMVAKYNFSKMYSDYILDAVVISPEIGQCGKTWDGDKKDFVMGIWAKFIDDVVKYIINFIENEN